MTRRERARWEACAKREAEWFYGTLGGRVPQNGSRARRRLASVVEEALLAIAPFHRGALSMWHTANKWPKELRAEFGPATTLVIRLECVQHPSVGVSTDAIEAAAVERLSVLLARRTDADERALARLETRARRHYDLAIRALAEARARLAARAGVAPVSGVVLTGETTARGCA